MGVIMKIKSGPVSGPGFYSMDSDEYRKHEALNHSFLKNLFPPKTPKDFLYAKENPQEQTQALSFGSAVHLAILQPEKLDLLAVAPTVDRRTTKGKEIYSQFVSESANKIIVSQEEMESINLIVSEVAKHPTISSLFKNPYYAEVPGFFDLNGVFCKFMPDCILPSDKLIIDLKTTNFGHERAFVNSVHEYCYHTQAEFYLTGIETISNDDSWKNFLWIVVENKKPHHIYLYEPDELWLDTARKMIAEAIETYKYCDFSGEWPGVSPEIKKLPAPKWYQF
jgi:hypothetical protein